MDALRRKKKLGLTIRKCRYRNKLWRKKPLVYLKQVRRRIAKADYRRLQSLLGLRAYAGAILASDLAATREFGLACIRVVQTMHLGTKPNIRWFHITLFSSEFEVNERKPALNIKRLKGKAYKEIQKLKLETLAWIDVHPVPNWPQGGEGGTFLFHIHALAWTEQPFDLDEARDKLAKSRSWSSTLGADPATIVEITPDMGTPAWWAGYGSRPPQAKRYHRSKAGSVSLKWTDKGFRPQLALRLVECLAQLEMMQMIFSVGEGKDLRDCIKRELHRWHRTRWADQKPIKPFNERKLFKRMWKQTKVCSYKHWRIIS